MSNSIVHIFDTISRVRRCLWDLIYIKFLPVLLNLRQSIILLLVLGRCQLILLIVYWLSQWLLLNNLIDALSFGYISWSIWHDSLRFDSWMSIDSHLRSLLNRYYFINRWFVFYLLDIGFIVFLGFFFYGM